MSSNHRLRQVVVVGAGVAGTTAAQTLRAEGYDGELTIVSAERHAPYHRPPLSKKLLTGQVHRAGIDLAPQNELNARALRGARAVGLDMSSRTVQLRDDHEDKSVQFDGLVIASGAVPRQWGPAGRTATCPMASCCSARSTTAWPFARSSENALASWLWAAVSSAPRSQRAFARWAGR